jgi:hypothetical protein
VEKKTLVAAAAWSNVVFFSICGVERQALAFYFPFLYGEQRFCARPFT